MSKNLNLWQLEGADRKRRRLAEDEDHRMSIQLREAEAERQLQLAAHGNTLLVCAPPTRLPLALFVFQIKIESERLVQLSVAALEEQERRVQLRVDEMCAAALRETELLGYKKGQQFVTSRLRAATPESPCAALRNPRLQSGAPGTLFRALLESHQVYSRNPEHAAWRALELCRFARGRPVPADSARVAWADVEPFPVRLALGPRANVDQMVAKNPPRTALLALECEVVRVPRPEMVLNRGLDVGCVVREQSVLRSARWAVVGGSAALLQRCYKIGTLAGDATCAEAHRQLVADLGSDAFVVTRLVGFDLARDVQLLNPGAVTELPRPLDVFDLRHAAPHRPPTQAALDRFVDEHGPLQLQRHRSRVGEECAALREAMDRAGLRQQTSVTGPLECAALARNITAEWCSSYRAAPCLGLDCSHPASGTNLSSESRPVQHGPRCPRRLLAVVKQM